MDTAKMHYIYNLQCKTRATTDETQEYLQADTGSRHKIINNIIFKNAHTSGKS